VILNRINFPPIFNVLAGYLASASGATGPIASFEVDSYRVTKLQTEVKVYPVALKEVDWLEYDAV
jgi:hypothetical protein